MLPSEFYERTGVNLTSEEYGRVENAYDLMKMDKDDFCRMWLEQRGNQFVEELIDAVNLLVSNNSKLVSERDSAKKEVEKVISRSDAERKIAKEATRLHLNELGEKLLLNLSDDDKAIYDILEEEYTLDFIVEVKLKNDRPLLQHEREHLINKLRSL